MTDEAAKAQERRHTATLNAYNQAINENSQLRLQANDFALQVQEQAEKIVELEANVADLRPEPTPKQALGTEKSPKGNPRPGKKRESQ